MRLGAVDGDGPGRRLPSPAHRARQRHRSTSVYWPSELSSTARRRVDRDTLALLLGGQLEQSTFSWTGRRRPRRRVVADHSAARRGGTTPSVAIGSTSPSGSQLVRVRRRRGSRRGVERAAEDALGGDVEPAGRGVGHQRLGVVGAVGVDEVVDRRRRRRGRRGRPAPAAPGSCRGTRCCRRCRRPRPCRRRPGPAPRRPCGSLSHVVDADGLAVAGSTAKTRPLSPESLVVTTSPSTTTSPLDSTISRVLEGEGDRRRRRRAGADGRAEQERHDDAARRPGRASAIEQLGQLRLDAPGGRPGRRTPCAASRP